MILILGMTTIITTIRITVAKKILTSITTRHTRIKNKQNLIKTRIIITAITMKMVT